MIAVVMVASCVVLANAQDLSMIRSEAALRSYAIEQASQVTASIGSSVQVGNNAFGYAQVRSNTVSGIIGAVKGLSLSADVANPKDPLYLWVGVETSEGDLLFTGNKQFNLSPPGKGTDWSLPLDYGTVTLLLVDNVAIRIPGIASAYVYTLGEDGKTLNGNTLGVSFGKLYFPRTLAGKNAIIAFYVYRDGVGKSPEGDWQYWHANNGTPLDPSLFNLPLQPAIDGVVTVTDKNVLMSVTTANRFGFNPVIEYTATKARTVQVSFWTEDTVILHDGVVPGTKIGDLKYFTGAWVRKAGSSEWVAHTEVFDLAAKFIQLDVEAGSVYYIIPMWNAADFIEVQEPYVPPSYEGGKG